MIRQYINQSTMHQSFNKSIIDRSEKNSDNNNQPFDLINIASYFTNIKPSTLKGTVDVISSDPPFKEWHFRSVTHYYNICTIKYLSFSQKKDWLFSIVVSL